MNKRTPGQCKVIEPTSDNPSRAIVCCEGATVYDAPLTTETKANAEFITLSWNAHDALEAENKQLKEENRALVGALKATLSDLDAVMPTDLVKHFGATKNLIKSALKETEGNEKI